jgi:predicted DsbA family dithiol-disulfide isomerase
LQEEFDVALEWHGFQLHPEVPPGGIAMREAFGESRAAMMLERLRGFAADFGLDLAAPARIPDTRRALAVAEHARDHGQLDRFRHLCMDAHWLEGRDIEADEVLADLATRAGLAPDAAVSAADDPAYRQRLEAAREAAFERGVTAIPTFFFGDYPVVGCQPYDTLRQVAERAGATRRAR